MGCSYPLLLNLQESQSVQFRLVNTQLHFAPQLLTLSFHTKLGLSFGCQTKLMIPG
jgi:hypothetical protein